MDFKAGAVWRVMVASYETLRKHTDALAGCVDLLVCDEGHRLKAAAGNKTINALLALRCPRRILVTGTPLQNNLEEFFGGRPPAESMPCCRSKPRHADNRDALRSLHQRCTHGYRRGKAALCKLRHCDSGQWR